MAPRTVGVLLAAGAGLRMGGPKALVTGDDGLPWIVSASRALTAGGCSDVVVVVGAEAGRARDLVTGEPVTVVEAADWAAGMAVSLTAGLAAAGRTSADAALVHLVDLPDVGADVVRRVRAHAAPDVLARAAYAFVAGHPVLLGRQHWAGIAAEAEGDRGARSYLGRHEVLLVECGDLAGGVDRDRAEVAGAQHPR